MADLNFRHIKSTRKRGGNVETYIYGGRDVLLKAIEQKGEAIPGDLARELGWSRSTLAHNLAKLQDQKKIVKIGGGRSTRYRVMTLEESNALPVTLPTQDRLPTQLPQAPAPAEEPQGKGILTAGLRSFFKKVIKG